MRAVLPVCGGAAAAPHMVSGGGVGGAAGAVGGEGGGRGARLRGAEGAGGGWRGGAHRGCGVHVNPLLHEAGESGEVALPRRLDKRHFRLRAQRPGLSASEEQGGEGVRVGRLAGVHDRSYADA